MRIDESKVFTIYGDNERKLDLKPDMEAFLKLDELTDNGFEAMENFSKDRRKRLVLLPVFIKAMAQEEISIDEIKEEFLGMSYVKVLQMSDVIYRLLFEELHSTNKVEEKNEVSPTLTNE